jgi:hypothetical protein
MILLHYLIYSCGELCFLISWCADDSYGMMDSDVNRDRSKRPGADDRG